ncbi:MAG: ABC transporter permease [Prevotella sp.]|nr:ABC transporter permease [Prevotella sp.]
MNLSFDIARSVYYNSDADRRISRPAVRIAMLGVAIGIAVMIVSVAVVLGFKHTVRDKVVGFGSHIVVTNFMTLQTTDQSQCINANDSLYRKVSSIKGVRHVERYSQKQGVLKTDGDFLGVVFKGIGEDYDTTFLAKNIVEGRMPQLSMWKSTQQLLLSRIQANRLGLKVGDKVFAYYLSDDDVRARPFTVAGIYQTNLTRYDESICFTDLYTMSRLNGWSVENKNVMEVTGMEVLVNDFDSIDSVEAQMIETINKSQDSDGHYLSSSTVKDQNPQIFSWLDLLDLNVWIILILMVSVSGFTMISGLLIIILERTSMIGLLKALGARNSMVRHTFLWLATFIVLRGLMWGNVLGIGICLLQKWTGLIQLDAATYYVSEVPIEMNWGLVVLLNVATLLLTTLTLVLPSFFVSTIKPAKTMRME